MPITLAKRQQVFRETVAFYAWLRSAPALLALFPLTRFILPLMGARPFGLFKLRREGLPSNAPQSNQLQYLKRDVAYVHVLRRVFEFTGDNGRRLGPQHRQEPGRLHEQDHANAPCRPAQRRSGSPQQVQAQRPRGQPQFYASEYEKYVSSHVEPNRAGDAGRGKLDRGLQK